jgi:hypothetical protein
MKRDIGPRIEVMDQASCHDHHEKIEKCDFRFSSPRPDGSRRGSSMSPGMKRGIGHHIVEVMDQASCHDQSAVPGKIDSSGSLANTDCSAKA